MKIVNVIPLKKGVLRKDLTYFTTKDVEVGNIVTIPIRSKKALALVISTHDVSSSKTSIKDMSFDLKKIIDVKEKSIFPKEYLESSMLLGSYFASSKSNAVTSTIPSVFRDKYDEIAKLPAINENIRLLNFSTSKSEKLLLQEPLENRVSIYKTLIRENFALKKSVFIVLPTEADIKYFEGHLAKGISEFTFTFHAGISDKKVFEKISKVLQDTHPVVILATAPFLSIPRHDLGVIVLEHESSNSYRMIAQPHLDFRLLAEIFAAKIKVKFILADTMLRFETIERQEIDHHMPMHPLLFRTNFNGNIEIQNRGKNTENSRLAQKNASFRIFSEKEISEIQNTLARKKNVFIFTLRKGLATETICRDCGEILMCKECKAPLVLYNLENDKRTFICNRCDEEKNVETACPRCKSWNLVPLGIGTDTVYEEISKTFSTKNGSNEKQGIKIFKLDKESVKNKKEVEDILKAYEENPGSILIGSPMALVYLKNQVHLSLIASFDSMWSIPNFKMSEKIIQFIISILSITENKLVIKTKNDKDPVLLAIQSGNLLPFVREELKERAHMGYPPFKRFIKIKHVGSEREAIQAEEILKEIFKEYKPFIFSGFITQIKGKYITNALIKIDTRKWSILSGEAVIEQNLLDKLLSLPPSFQVLVDPEDLL